MYWISCGSRHLSKVCLPVLSGAGSSVLVSPLGRSDSSLWIIFSNFKWLTGWVPLHVFESIVRRHLSCIGYYYECVVAQGPRQPQRSKQFLVYYIFSQARYGQEWISTLWPSCCPFLNILAGILTSRSVGEVILSWLDNPFPLLPSLQLGQLTRRLLLYGFHHVSGLGSAFWLLVRAYGLLLIVTGFQKQILCFSCLKWGAPFLSR